MLYPTRFEVIVVGGGQVARLAGVPREGVERAKEILSQLENQHLDEAGRPKIAGGRARQRVGRMQLTLFAPIEHPLMEQLRTLDLNDLTPLAALQLLEQWQQQLAAEANGGASKRKAVAK